MLDDQGQRTAPKLGMLGCDREVFAQVWDRVAPGEDSPVEVLPAPAEETLALPQEIPTGEDPEGRALQGMILDCLTDAGVYRDLTRRSRRARGELLELAGRKTRQAKGLSAAYFLRSGVRYWPREATPVRPPESFFPLLRQRFFAEEEMAGRFRALGEGTRDAHLQTLCADLAEECRELACAIGLIIQRET